MSKRIEWRTVVGYEGLYEVSSAGDVVALPKKTHKRRIKLTKGISWDGYYQVGLWKNGKSKTTKVHKIVAKTFIDNPFQKPCINHIDGDKLNNSVENLEWCTNSENDKHAFRLGLRKSPLLGVCHQGEKHNQAKLTELDVLYIRSHYKVINRRANTEELAKMFGVSHSCIHSIVERRTWTHI